MQQEAWWVVVACVIVSEIQTALAAWERTCTPFTKSFGPHPRGLCGSNIDEALSLLCINGYNDIGHRHRKKRDSGFDTKAKLHGIHGILIPREEANSYLVKRSSFYERGIVCECCYHSCNLMELFSYCRNGPGIFGIFKRSVDRQTKIRKHKKHKLLANSND